MTYGMNFPFVMPLLAERAPLDKCTTSSQVDKSNGFWVDTAHFKVLRIPLAKREPVLAVAEYHLAIVEHREFSDLLLAVSMGILESLWEFLNL